MRRHRFFYEVAWDDLLRCDAYYIPLPVRVSQAEPPIHVPKLHVSAEEQPRGVTQVKPPITRPREIIGEVRC